MDKAVFLREKGYYKLWHKAQGAAFQDANLDPAAEFWVLIEPHLQGEFPRVAARRVAMYLWRDGLKMGVDEMEIWIGQVVDKFERLWNGDPSGHADETLVGGLDDPRGTPLKDSGNEMTRGSNSDFELYGGPPTKRRFTFDEVKEILRGKMEDMCPTCGGSGETTCDIVYPDRKCLGHMVPCPDCTEKKVCPTCGGSGEQYAFCEHCEGDGCSHCNKTGKDGMEPCPDCKPQRTDKGREGVEGRRDQRKGEERRLRTRRSHDLVGRRNWHIEGPGELLHRDRRDGADRRKRTGE